MDTVINYLEQGRVPDILIRLGLRWMLRDRLRRQKRMGLEARRQGFRDLISQLRQGPIAVLPENPTEHLYEFPPVLFKDVIGKRLKYSCCYWPEGLTDLDRSEEAMLDLTCRRAQIEDGMDVLDLGCGAGSFSFWMAERYPKCRILALSNVARQREFIESQCRERGITNLEVITADINDFQAPRPFDRVVSVEMFDHMRNYEKLMAKVASWLKPSGKLFVHMVTHREYAMPARKTYFEDWMARYFFFGGLVASDSLLLYFQDDLLLEDHWHVSGIHFEKTVDAWLANVDSRREKITAALQTVLSPDETARWINRWRIMLMCFQEAFGCRGGDEWMISHYLFGRREK